MKRNILASLCIASVLLPQSLGLNNGVGLTPAMGWNSWNAFGCDITEDKFKANVDKIVLLGLNKLGYKYMNLDDCWQSTDRTTDGYVQANTTSFPSGIKALADYVHTQNLSFGIYSSAGTKTCQSRAGSLNYEAKDAEQYAAWEVDYLKYDNCFNQNVPATTRYSAMRDALKAQNRTIYYSICNWGEENVWTWGSSTGNSWRTSTDIEAKWGSIKYNFIQATQHPESAGSGGWNDPDMLEVGNGALTITEQKTHFALWCFLRAPLILGNDFSNTGAEVLAIISNPGLIAVNQDPYGKQAVCVMNCNNDLQVYSSYQINNGNYWAILAVNWNDEEAQSVVIDFSLLGIAPASYYNCQLTDLWTNTIIGTYQRQYLVKEVQPHDNVALKIKCTLPTGFVEENFEEEFLQ